MRKKNNDRKKLLITLSLIVVLLYGAQNVKTLSRYIYNSIKEFYLKSQNFYFYSDKLKSPTLLDPYMVQYNADNWSGVEDYEIQINMNSIENNNLRCAENINYYITYNCSNNITCQLENKTEDISNPGQFPSIIDTTTHSDDFTLIVTPLTALAEETTVWVEVTATATFPYTKTLQARFNITVRNIGMSYNIEDSANSPYLDFNVTNTLDYYIIDEAFSTYSINDRIDIDEYLALSQENKDKCHSMEVTLSFDPEEVLIDMSSSAYLNATSTTTTTIAGATYIESLTYKIDAISSNRTRFYKVDKTEDYTFPNGVATSIITITYR